METMKPLEELKMLCREKQAPYFSDDELNYQLQRAGGDIDLAAYRCLIIKAENSTVQVSGLTLADTSRYWLRLAASVRPSGSCVIEGG
ncbi:MAG: hypothetical protein LKJ50_04015 [Clostridiales bacterium]|jgi:hypothetical protein|nr:hypothetical protein [Clostridiales bacterium]MCI1961106.1 hypothetical protein [Clostridiales bacterium]MCI2021547.1 hypothetical protein [Clostridiales bacterium]MCI2026333.1 hypothetical protein [Clostridiales bacterium]CAB1240139.1 conserved protein of unknown function [Ruminococcaceae bacterium BL-4]